MFKLCFNSTTLRNFDVFEALSLIKAHGYEGVELTLNDAHLHPLNHGRERYKAVKAHCEVNEIEVVCLAAGGPDVMGAEPYEPSLIHPNSSMRRRRMDFIKRSMELADYLNSAVLIINSGKLKAGVSQKAAHDYLFECVQELSAQAGSLILALEPEPDFYIGTTQSAVDLIGAVNSDNLRLNLDIGHVFCSEDYCYEHIERSLPHARHIHIEDIKGGVHRHEIPGEGDIDFERIVRLIKQSGYGHYVSVELHHHDAVWQKALKASRDYLLGLMAGRIA